MTRRLFLKRAGQAAGIIVFLPAARAIGNMSPLGTDYYEHTVIAMGTTARVGVYAASEEAANSVINACFAELKRIEALLTIFDASSEIAKINASAGHGTVNVSKDTLAILQASKAYAGQTNDAFDITVEPLMRLWGFRSESNTLTHLPSDAEIAEARKVVGSDQLIINGSAASLRRSGAKLDLGGIAVGYALDQMAAILRAATIDSAFIDISGDMFALGAPAGKKGWDIAIPNPNDPSKVIHKTQISDQALATSGNYMSYVTYRAQKFGHIMDPREGRSADSLLSATVITNSGIDADALSTASFVSGERYGDTQLIFVGIDGKLRFR